MKGWGAMTETVKARDLKPGTCIMVRGKAIQVDAIVEVPEMHGRTLWYEELGRGEYLAVDLDDELEIASEDAG